MTSHDTTPGRSRVVTGVSRTLILIAIATLIVLGGCSDSPTEPEPAPGPAPVASVMIVPETIQLTVGETRQLAASPRDAQGNTLTRPVTWTSSDVDVATVDASGLVRAIADGTVTIRAASEGKEGNAAVEVQAAIPAELELSRSNLMFTGIAAIQSPAPSSINVTVKNGVADGLIAQIHYGTGDPQGWLSATFSATAAPAALTITAQTGLLLPGSYTARIAIRSSTRPEIIAKDVNVMFVVQPGPQLNVLTADRHNCAVDRNGELYCWGYNQSRQLGIGSLAQYEASPVRFTGGRKFMKIATGELFGCGITVESKAFCWGTGYMGDGVGGVVGAAPREVAGNHAWAQLAAGNRHACGITTNGETYCWGTNGGGQLGNGVRTDQNQPVKVGGGHTFVAITAGEEFTCGLVSNGDAYCWGRTAYGRLGQTVTSTDAVLSPLKVPGNIQWQNIEAGRHHACAVASTGIAYCWGYNGNGQLGDNSRTDRPAPTPVATAQRFTSVSAGNYHSCGITTTGQAVCWGHRSPGAMGDGIRDGYALTPVAVAPVGSTFARITAGNAHSCAVTTDDKVYCWGYNANGAVGDGTTAERLLPVRVQLD